MGTHLNGDECFSKGASFLAANYSSSFRTRNLLLSDGLNHPVNVEVLDYETDEV